MTAARGKGKRKGPKRAPTPNAALAVQAGLPPYPVRWAFVKAYEACGTITGAADAVGVGRRKHYDWAKEEGPAGDAYRKAFAEATQRHVERMEEEAVRRAVEGTVELVIDRGQPVMVGITAEGDIVPAEDDRAVTTRALVKKRMSDQLLMFVLKAKAPAVYGDRRAVEVSGPGGEPVQIEATVEERTDRFSEGFWELMDLAGAADALAPVEGEVNEG